MHGPTFILLLEKKMISVYLQMNLHHLFTTIILFIKLNSLNICTMRGEA
jgi:hypothetical protein